jgi:hypothetical protein
LSLLQEPPRALGASATITVGPPVAGMRFSFPSEKNPICRLSADQKGNEAPSVSSRRCAAIALSGCTQIDLTPSARATKATCVPSGERVGGPAKSPVMSRETFSGGRRTARTTGCGAGAGRSATAAPAAISASAATPQARRGLLHKRPRRAATVAAAGVEESTAMKRSCRSRSCADWKRSSGSFARQVRMTWSSAAGADGRSVVIGCGSAARIEAMTLACVFPSNGRRPVAISYRTVPKAKMSARASASAPSICSGAMYWKVPTMVPCAVSGCAWVGSAVMESTASAPRRSFARPKSSSFAPPLVRMMFPGLRSRCTTPWRCALSRASATAMAMRSSSGVGIDPRSRRAASVSPSRYSMTRKSTDPPACSWRPTSYSVQMWGCWNPDSARASRSKRARRSGFAETCAGRTLMATTRSRRVSRAL